MKRYALIIALILCCSCVQPEQGEGNVTIHFATTGVQQTKAEEDPPTYEELVAEGNYIYANEGEPDLVILIAEDDATGNIVASYPGKGLDATGFLKSRNDTEASIQFLLPSGGYKVYAFANTRGLNGTKWRLDGQGVGQSAKDFLLSQSTSADLEGLLFEDMDKPLRPYGTEGVDEAYVVTYMPLSAKGSLTVSNNGNGEVSLELLRCVAKVTATIKNQTGTAQTLYEYKHWVHKMFPSTGYLVPHEPDNADADPGAIYAEPGIPIPISPDGSLPYSWFVFPSEGPYTIDIQFTLNKGNSAPVNPGDPPAEKDYKYTGLPVTDWKSVDIPSLARNQHLSVVTRLSKGVTVSFNFKVAGWGEAWEESVHFD